MFLSELDVGFLSAVGSDQGVDLLDLNIVELLERASDRLLGGLQMGDKSEHVEVFDLSHRLFGGQRISQERIGVGSGVADHALSWVFRVLRLPQGNGPLEMNRKSSGNESLLRLVGAANLGGGDVRFGCSGRCCLVGSNNSFLLGSFLLFIFFFVINTVALLCFYCIHLGRSGRKIKES